MGNVSSSEIYRRRALGPVFPSMDRFDELTNLNPEALTADGLEDALIGYTSVMGRTLAVYDVDSVIDIFMTRDGMSYEDAREFFEFNVEQAWMGENTPLFLTRFDGVTLQTPA
jgi:hypothetical protein